jgi:hypothetical protein
MKGYLYSRSEPKRIQRCNLRGRVVIPNNFEVIGANAFAGSEATSVVFAGEEVSERAFAESAVVEVEVSCSKLGELAFANASHLERVILRDCVSIPAECFVGTCLEEIVIPCSVRSIGRRAFAGVSSLREVKFEGRSLLEIGESAFEGCGLRQVDLPASVERIGDWAFAKTKLLEVIFPSGMKRIGSFAFDTPTLRMARLPRKKCEIGSGAFAGRCELVCGCLSAKETKKWASRAKIRRLSAMIIASSLEEAECGCL